MRKLVYVASPYSGLDQAKAFELAVEASREIKEAGFVPVNPIMLFDGIYNEDTEREAALKAGLKVLESCDYIYINKINGYWEDSEGIKAELEMARKKGIYEIEWQKNLIVKMYLGVKR